MKTTAYLPSVQVKNSIMLEFIELLIHFVTTVFKLLKPGGVKVVMAETIAMKQQLIDLL